jgi:hypothetical protein
MPMGEKKRYICQNPSCKTAFTVPLKTLNLQENPTEPYYACPFCLTKIEDAPLKIEAPAEKPSEINEKKQQQGKHDQNVNAEKPLSCRFHLGYLSERTQNADIPEDCLVCRSIVDCMLKRMQDE